MLDHHIQISFNSRCEIIPQTPAWVYKYVSKIWLNKIMHLLLLLFKF